jgi:hypothetical protein
MGVAIYIKSFSKNDKTVLNELKSLKFYDVDNNVIDSYKSGEIILQDLEIIDKLVSENIFYYFTEKGFFLQLTDFAFYVFAISNMNGFGYNSDENYEYSIAHDPQNIIGTIEKLIKIINIWDNDIYGELNVSENKKSLILLEQFLNESILKGNLVNFTFG